MLKINHQGAKTISFKTISKKIKYLGINLAKGIKCFGHLM